MMHTRRLLPFFILALTLALAGLPARAQSPTEAHGHSHPHEHVHGEPGELPTPYPDRIALTWSDDPATTMSVTWRTDPTVADAVAQVAVARAEPSFYARSETVQADTELLDLPTIEDEHIQAHYHSATFTGLQPNTLYAYRVGDGARWSEWFHARTASDEADPMSFIYFGDAQNNVRSLWSRAIRAAYAEAPDALFMIHAGDLVDGAHNNIEWGHWHEAGSFIQSMLPNVPVPGNHEYGAFTEAEDDRDIEHLSAHWRPGFTLPTNGAEGFEESTYVIDIQGVRFIGLDSEPATEDDEALAVQTAWLDSVLTHNSNRWTVPIFHHPIFSSGQGRDNPGLRAAWRPLFDEHHVDIVLQGHDHTYARGRAENLAEGMNVRSPVGGTVYVNSVSGAKMYEINPGRWESYYGGVEMERAAENTQLFQVIDVAGDTLQFRAYTVTGELYDAFDLVKGANGAPNEFIARLPEDAPERTHENTLLYARAGDTEAEGTIERAGSDFIEIGGTRYALPEETAPVDGNAASLLEGMFAEVEFRRAADGTLVATEFELEVEDVVDRAGDGFVEIDGRRYVITDETEFEGGDAASLAEGVFVELKVAPSADGTLVATEIELDVEERRITGRVTALETDGDRTFVVVGSTRLEISDETEFLGIDGVDDLAAGRTTAEIGYVLKPSGDGYEAVRIQVGEYQSSSSDRGGAAADRQTAFRVRSDFDAGLNADEGWAGALNENVTVNVEEPFRLRFELESAADASQERRFQLQYRRNGGAWTNVDAQLFPKPLRERELDFEQHEVGDMPEGWRLVQGNTSGVEVAADEQERFLRARAEAEPLLGMSRYEPRWEPVEFATDIRLPDGNQSGAGLIFGYVDPENYYRVYLDAEGAVRVSRFVDGEETIITEESASVVSSRWLEVQVTLDGDAAEVEFDDDTVTFMADLGDAVPPSALGFYVPAHSTAEFEQFAIEGEPRTPRVSIVASEAFEDEEATTDLLEGSNSPFAGGASVNSVDKTIAWSEGNGQSEWEWPLVIRRFADGAVTNDDGDTFQFRMADADGAPIASDAHPEITASVPPRLLAGTFVETPARIGPWEASNGDLYFLMEPAETYNVLMVVKSTDGGQTWEEVDGANRPATGDLEGFASDVSEGTIHMLHQTSDEVLHHAFRMSDHPTDPDTWSVRDDTVATPEEPPTQVASLTIRSDGSMVGVYGGPEKIHYKICSTDGTWGEETVIDADEPPAVLSGPQTVLGEDDVVHLAYTGIGETDGTIWYRRIRPDGTLTPREQLASGVGTDEGDVGSVLPLVFLPETNTAVVIYRLATGKLWERRITDHGPPSAPVQVSDRDVVQNAVDADQTGADAVADGTTVHVLFIEEGSGSIFHTRSDEPGEWESATLQVDGITGQWIRGIPLRRGADAPSVYGYVYDAGSDGGSGMNRYGEVPLEGR